MQSVDNLKRRCFFHASKTRSVRSKFQPDHQAEAAHLLQNRGKLPDQSRQFAFHEVSQLEGMIGQLIALDDFENLQGHGAAERRAAERRGMRSRRKDTRVLFAYPERANRKSAAQ